MTDTKETAISYIVSEPLSDDELNGLAMECWSDHEPASFGSILERSLLYVSARHEQQLVGFVNLAWDGGEHTFLLDTQVHPDYRRRGIGTSLVKRAVDEARTHGCKWVHVDFEPHLKGFYVECGFGPTEAGLFRLR